MDRHPVLLVDTSALVYRAFYGLPRSLRAPDGTPIGAVRGTLGALTGLLRSRRAAGCVACADADWRPAFRVAAWPGYKGARVGPDGTEAMPADLAVQLPLLDDVLAALGVARAAAPGYEADDVIATLARRMPGRSVEIVTVDRDLLSLVDDASGVAVLLAGRGGFTRLDEAGVQARYHVPARAYGDFALLRGDPSDGLPGVPGVGERTAARLLATWPTADALFAAAQALEAGQPPVDSVPAERAAALLPAGLRARLLAARAGVAAMAIAATLVSDAPVGPVDPRPPDAPHDPRRLAELAARYGLATPIARLSDTLAELAGWHQPPAPARNP